MRTRTTTIVTTVWAARLIRNPRRPIGSPLAYHRPSRLQPSPASSGSTATQRAGETRARDLRFLPPPAAETNVDAARGACADHGPADQGHRSGVNPYVALWWRHVQHNEGHL